MILVFSLMWPKQIKGQIPHLLKFPSHLLVYNLSINWKLNSEMNGRRNPNNCSVTANRYMHIIQIPIFSHFFSNQNWGIENIEFGKLFKCKFSTSPSIAISKSRFRETESMKRVQWAKSWSNQTLSREVWGHELEIGEKREKTRQHQ